MNFREADRENTKKKAEHTKNGNSVDSRNELKKTRRERCVCTQQLELIKRLVQFKGSYPPDMEE